jgi:hypothetical protein
MVAAQSIQPRMLSCDPQHYFQSQDIEFCAMNRITYTRAMEIASYIRIPLNIVGILMDRQTAHVFDNLASPEKSIQHRMSLHSHITTSKTQPVENSAFFAGVPFCGSDLQDQQHCRQEGQESAHAEISWV